jgi:STE24 endopeptidase
MSCASLCFGLTAALTLARWAVQLWLEHINRRHVLALQPADVVGQRQLDKGRVSVRPGSSETLGPANAGCVPEALRACVDAATYAKSIQYTLAKSLLTQYRHTFDAALLLALILTGALPWGFDRFTSWLGASVWAVAAYLFVVWVALISFGLPFDWYSQFRLEAQFGFNTSTAKLWWADRLRGLLLGLTLGYPLLILVLQIAAWAGSWWWVWAWATVLAFQLLTVILAPALILPLFNQLTPLPEGSLRDRLSALAARTRFRVRSIQVMDGSKRSLHANAFFTGFGLFRKIVLFDTLIGQLTELELEAVLAHEIGHFHEKHSAKMLLWSAAGSLLGFYALAWLARQDWFYLAFGFHPGQVAAAFLLFAVLGGVVTFWIAPLVNLWLRRQEYQADAFAAHALESPTPLVSALRKLSQINLSNLSPHPLYSRFYYSHPTLLERERALARPDISWAGDLGPVQRAR